MESDQAFNVFQQELEQALHHLYDPGVLRRSPLLLLFGLAESGGGPKLQQIILTGIEALRPHAGASPQAKGRRLYLALSHRYADQFSQQEVARALGIGIRHLRRQEALAVRALAGHLWARYDLQAKASSLLSAVSDPARDEAPSREQELQWLERSTPSEVIGLDTVIAAALKVLDPLLKVAGVRVVCQLAADLPPLLAQSATLRQALIAILSTAVPAARRGVILITAEGREGQIAVTVVPRSDALASPVDIDKTESLAMARQLLALCGSSLAMQPSPEPGCPLAVRMELRAAIQQAVLVVDDNEDTLQLFGRYLSGTRYAFVGTRQPQEALALAARFKPRIIVLDVMLPDVDGWELLGHLREDPCTRGTPVLVCTILPEEHLALALGAAAFLRKPVSRAAFLAVLDALTESRAPECAG